MAAPTSELRKTCMATRPAVPTSVPSPMSCQDSTSCDNKVVSVGLCVVVIVPLGELGTPTVQSLTV